MNKPVRSKNAGFATVLVLLAIVVMFTMGTALLKLGQNSRIGAVRGASEIAARCAADSGLTKAVFEMNEKLKDEFWNDSNLPQATDQPIPGCDATFSYTVQWDAGNGYVIESTGRSSRAVKKIACTLFLSGPFEHAILTQEEIALKSGTVVDWYNYEAGDESLKIGTNSTVSDTINLSPGATVNGDIVVGPGGDPDEIVNAGSATVTGQIYAAIESYDFLPVTVPASVQDLASRGTLTSSTVITSGEYKYDSININNSKAITIDGEVTLYVTGDVTLMNSSNLEIVDTNPDASLTLYLGGDYEGKNSSNMNNLTREPKKLKIYGLESCQSIDFKNGTDFYGVIYTPNADVIFYNSADAFGAVAAESFEQKNSATFNYDVSLRQGDLSDQLARFVVKRWCEQ